MNPLLITSEILFTVVSPLLVLYLTGTWKQQTMVACMSTIPTLWYFVYAPIHELSHLLGAYLLALRLSKSNSFPGFGQESLLGRGSNQWASPTNGVS